MSIEDHLKYKYQILADGNTAAWSRAYWQLFSNSVIFKNDSDFIQWYYDALAPFKHYIPVANDFHNLIEMLEWAKKNDEVCQEIFSNAQAFARENLSLEAMMAYTYRLLVEYSKIQTP